jgi:hypothetical protein
MATVHIGANTDPHPSIILAITRPQSDSAEVPTPGAMDAGFAVS